MHMSTYGLEMLALIINKNLNPIKIKYSLGVVFWKTRVCKLVVRIIVHLRVTVRLKTTDTQLYTLSKKKGFSKFLIYSWNKLKLVLVHYSDDFSKSI